MPAAPTPTAPTPTVRPPSRSLDRLSARDRLILFTLAASQLLVILDTTIVNIAIPHAADALRMDASGRQWIITAYALTFGAVLLIGGRIADYWGRRRTFILGLVVFAIASLVAGLAFTGEILIVGRILQGAGAALMAPAALSLVSVSFPTGRARVLAFGVLGGVTSSGAAVGLILGGFLTEFVDWRWCLLVNVPVVIAALVAAAVVLPESRVASHARLDIAGAITVSTGLSAIVYGFAQAERGWTDLGVVLALATGVALLAAFVVIESCVASPLLPLRVLLHRNRGGALIVQACGGAAMTTVTLYITFHLQFVLGLSPLLSGIATIPLAVAIAAAIPVLIKVVPRTGPRALLVGGPIVAAVGALLLARVSPSGSYWGDVLPGLLVLGVGMAGIFVPAQNMALSGVHPDDAGAAAAAANATNQIGGAIGLAILTTVYTAAAGTETSGAALTAGYSAVFVGSALTLGLAAFVAFALIRPQKNDVMGEVHVPAMH
ncbi:MFS transporter [Microbacterium sp.]|uniref:MFS transporter n=1 Tax=Microbacterium sp. TaxID=51671 RepID=UPI0037C504C1